MAADAYRRRSETDRVTWRFLCRFITPRRSLDGDEVIPLDELDVKSLRPPVAPRRAQGKEGFHVPSAGSADHTEG